MIAALALAAAAATAAPLQSSGTLPGGGTYVMQRETSAHTAAMELWFRAPSAGYDSQYPGIARLAITALAASSAPHATSLTELVNRFGGTLMINVYPDIAMVGVSVPSWDARRVLHALTSTYFSPRISDAGLKIALRDCAIAAAQTHFDTARQLQDALFKNLFSSGPAHFAPTPGSADAFTKIPQDALNAFASRTFRTGNAVLALAGNVDQATLSSVSAGSSGGAMPAPFDSTLSKAPGDQTATGESAGLGFAWTGPAITDTKAATALDFIADYLFDPQRGVLAQQLRKSDPDADLNGQFITLHNPGVLILTIDGANSPALRSAVLAAVQALEQPLDQRTFQAARNLFEYHLFSQIETPTSTADNFGWYAAEGNAAYAPGILNGDYLQNVQALDPSFIAQIVRTYLQHPAVVQLISADEKGTNT